MTCDEAEALAERQVTEVTRAERTAFLAHLMECPPCRAKAQADYEASTMTEEEAAEVDALWRNDFLDPECPLRPTTRGEEN